MCFFLFSGGNVGGCDKCVYACVFGLSAIIFYVRMIVRFAYRAFQATLTTLLRHFIGSTGFHCFTQNTTFVNDSPIYYMYIYMLRAKGERRKSNGKYPKKTN